MTKVTVLHEYVQHAVIVDVQDDWFAQRASMSRAFERLIQLQGDDIGDAVGPVSTMITNVPCLNFGHDANCVEYHCVLYREVAELPAPPPPVLRPTRRRRVGKIDHLEIYDDALEQWVDAGPVRGPLPGHRRMASGAGVISWNGIGEQPQRVLAGVDLDTPVRWQQPDAPPFVPGYAEEGDTWVETPPF